MGKVDKILAEKPKRKIDLTGIAGTAPGLKAKEIKRYRAKVFKSGNSLALRLPAGLGLKAGTEMDLRVEDGEYFAFEPAEKPKRKIDVSKFAGKAPWLKVPLREDFDDPPRAWDRLDLSDFRK